MRKCTESLGCICKLCMARAYNDYLDDPQADPEVISIVAEIVLEEYEEHLPQDVDMIPFDEDLV